MFNWIPYQANVGDRVVQMSQLAATHKLCVEELLEVHKSRAEGNDVVLMRVRGRVERGGVQK